MNLYEFMSDSPFLTFFILFGIGAIVKTILVYCIGRPLRTMNIKRHGWPPEHLDADGDFKVDDE